MKKNKTNNRLAKITAAGAFIAFQAMPETASAQKPVLSADSVRQSAFQKKHISTLKFSNTKLAEQKLTVVALLNGDPVVKIGSNELYKMDTQTGDVQLVKPEEYNKLSFGDKTNGSRIYSAKERPFKVEGIKLSYKCEETSFYSKNQIVLLGVDKDGHEIFQNIKKEKFYFDPATGDMVDFAGHIALFR